MAGEGSSLSIVEKQVVTARWRVHPHVVLDERDVHHLRRRDAPRISASTS